MRRQRKHVEPDAKLTLALSRDERNLVVNNWSISMGLTPEQLQALKAADKPELCMTLADWDDFAGLGRGDREPLALHRSGANRRGDNVGAGLAGCEAALQCPHRGSAG